MSVPERKMDPSDLTEAELASQHVPQRRRLFVVEEADDETLVVIVPRSVSRAEAPHHAATDLADEEFPSLSYRTSAVKSFIHAVWSEDLAANIAEGFAWSKHLPDDDRQHFVDDVRTELKKVMTSGDLEPYFQLIDEWHSTAEVWADPETLAALTTDPDPTGDPDAPL